LLTPRRGAKATASLCLAKPVFSGTIQNFLHDGENSIFSSDAPESSTFFFRFPQNFYVPLQKFISPEGVLKKFSKYVNAILVSGAHQRSLFPQGFP